MQHFKYKQSIYSRISLLGVHTNIYTILPMLCLWLSWWYKSIYQCVLYVLTTEFFSHFYTDRTFWICAEKRKGKGNEKMQITCLMHR